MSSAQQLAWESRTGKLAAAAAAAVVVLTIGGGVYISAALSARPQNSREYMLALDEESGVFTVSAVIQAVGLAAAALALAYLYRVVKHRRPELPSFALPLAILGPLLLAVAGVLTQLGRIDSAAEYLASGPRTDGRAKDLLNETSDLTLGLGLAGALSFGFALILLNVSAMRAGIESRFMGIMGVIVGVLPVLGSLVPIGGPGFVQVFWFAALALLFLGRWPGGRGPAWQTGEAIPWPSSAERSQRAGRDSMAGAVPADDPTIKPASELDHPADDASDPPGEAQPASKKRKRKRRR